MVRRLFSLLFLAVLPSTINGQVIINEAMINEPGSHTTLEWIELFNTADTTVSLIGDTLVVGDDTLGFSGTMEAKSYLIVCRRLFSSGTTPGFEEYWGNNSGVWGDDSTEGYVRPIEWSGMSLTNASGEILLVSFEDTLSRFNWAESPPDGISLERKYHNDNAIEPCVDPLGSTHGHYNSVSPLAHDLLLYCRATREPYSGDLGINYGVTNIGLEPVSDVWLHVFIAETPIPDGWDSLVISEYFGTVFPHSTQAAWQKIEAPGPYVLLRGEIPIDDHPNDNQVFFRLPGPGFPPVVMSEAMIATSQRSHVEWIELANRSPYPCDLADLRFAAPEMDSSASISAGPFDVGPGEFVVLTPDSSLFRASYPSYSGRICVPQAWPRLRDNGDKLFLLYHFNIQADRLEYQQGLPAGHTLCREQINPAPERWGISAESGGTPGAPNGVVYVANDSVLAMSITPRVFSPDGDGIDETVSLVIKSPSASSFALRVFDREGRMVRELFKDQDYLAGMYLFDGNNDAGQRLPIGIYIVLFEAETYDKGHQECKSTVVIAR